MTRYEFFQLHTKILQVMKDNGISVDDFSNVVIYDEYMEMRKDSSNKIEYILATIAEKYRVGRTTIYNIVHRMEKEVSIK